MSKPLVMQEHLDDWPPSPPGVAGWPWQAPAAARADESEIQWPRISLVTPSFQQGAMIEKTLRSVLLQRYPNLEYIVIDGGSTDGTVEILKKYAPFLGFWVSEGDRGQSDAINKGLARCTGEIFNWLNSDDVLEPGALREVGRLWRDKQPLLLTGGCENVDAAGRLEHRWVARPPTRLRDFFTPHAVVLAQPSTFLRTDAVRASGGIREDLECVMDWELYVRLLLKAPQDWKTEKTSLCLSRALQHPAAKTQRLSAKFREEAARLMDDWLPKAPVSERPAILSRRKAMETEARVTATAQRPHALAALTRLAIAEPDVIGSRFFWGALRRSWRSL